MPLTCTCTFRVRHYECDPFDEVNYSTYLAYLQETAFDATEAVGFGPAKLQEMGYYWIVHETEIEYFDRFRYGDVVEVTTWVDHFTRVLSHRVYEMRREGTADVVARAATEWVFVEAASGRPTRIPEDMGKAYQPDGPADRQRARDKLPRNVVAPENGVTALRSRVQWHELDPAAHVNNTIYLAYVEDAATAAFAAAGWSPKAMRDAGIDPYVKRHHIRYAGQAVLGDELDVRGWFTETDESGARRYTEIRRVRDEALLNQCVTEYAWRAAPDSGVSPDDGASPVLAEFTTSLRAAQT